MPAITCIIIVYETQDFALKKTNQQILGQGATERGDILPHRALCLPVSKKRKPGIHYTLAAWKQWRMSTRAGSSQSQEPTPHPHLMRRRHILKNSSAQAPRQLTPERGEGEPGGTQSFQELLTRLRREARRGLGWKVLELQGPQRPPSLLNVSRKAPLATKVFIRNTHFPSPACTRTHT